MHSTQTTLSTARLELQPLSEEHCSHVIDLDADSAVMRYVENGHPLSASAAIADHGRRLASADAVPGLGYWAGFLDGAFVGWWALTSSSGPAQAELGYRLLPRFWGRGLAKEGARELLRHGFAEVGGLDRVYGEAMAVNAASRATMAACGLKYVRAFYMDFAQPIPGTEMGEVEYAVSREEWLLANKAYE